MILNEIKNRPSFLHPDFDLDALPGITICQSMMYRNTYQTAPGTLKTTNELQSNVVFTKWRFCISPTVVFEDSFVL